MVTVVRTWHALGSRRGLTTLEQRFRFGGDGVNAASIADVLFTSPLTGGESVFGDRPGVEGARTDGSRTLRGFSPAPGFRFDVALVPKDTALFLVRFSQAERKVPYLEGDLVWSISDEGDAALLDEQINTDRAFQVASKPLSGPRPSLRRWLFFRVGHKSVMSRAAKNVAALLDQPAR